MEIKCDFCDNLLISGTQFEIINSERVHDKIVCLECIERKRDHVHGDERVY